MKHYSMRHQRNCGWATSERIQEMLDANRSSGGWVEDKGRVMLDCEVIARLNCNPQEWRQGDMSLVVLDMTYEVLPLVSDEGLMVYAGIKGAMPPRAELLKMAVRELCGSRFGMWLVGPDGEKLLRATTELAAGYAMHRVIPAGVKSGAVTIAMRPLDGSKAAGSPAAPSAAGRLEALEVEVKRLRDDNEHLKSQLEWADFDQRTLHFIAEVLAALGVGCVGADKLIGLAALLEDYSQKAD